MMTIFLLLGNLEGRGVLLTTFVGEDAYHLPLLSYHYCIQAFLAAFGGGLRILVLLLHTTAVPPILHTQCLLSPASSLLPHYLQFLEGKTLFTTYTQVIGGRWENFTWELLPIGEELPFTHTPTCLPFIPHILTFPLPLFVLFTWVFVPCRYTTTAWEAVPAHLEGKATLLLPLPTTTHTACLPHTLLYLSGACLEEEMPTILQMECCVCSGLCSTDFWRRYLYSR